MALEEKDIKALQLLIREEIRSQIEPIEKRITIGFSDVMNTLDTLISRDEKSEQENLVLNEQIKRHDHRIETLEKKVA